MYIIVKGDHVAVIAIYFFFFFFTDFNLKPVWDCVEWRAGVYQWRGTLHISLHLGVSVLPQTLQNNNINLHLSSCRFIANTPKLQYLVIDFFFYLFLLTHYVEKNCECLVPVQGGLIHNYCMHILLWNHRHSCDSIRFFPFAKMIL